MLHRLLLVSAPGVIGRDRCFCPARPAGRPASPKAAEIEPKIEQAKAQIEAAQAALAALEQELADAQAAATDDLIQRARAGEEAATRGPGPGQHRYQVCGLRLRQNRQGAGREALPAGAGSGLAHRQPAGEEQVRLDARRERHGGGRGPAAHRSGQGDRPGRHRQRHLRALALPVLAGEPRRGQAPRER